MSVATSQQKSEEISKIDKADDLKISPFRSVSSTWYQSSIKQKAGRIHAAGIIKDVLFEPVTGNLNVQIDEAYKSKYNNSPYLQSMTSNRARSATVKITLNS